MYTLTIITPTYNRANLLNSLYISLTRQSEYDFEWLVVDDGSEDNTKDVVEDLKKKAMFPIRYIYKSNGGKHTALNVGIKTIDTDLIMIVDSDDQLLPNAIDEIKKIHKRYKSNELVGAYCFLRCYSNNIPIISLDRDEFLESYVKFRIKENRPGDMAEVFKTNVLKDYPFPEFEEERFLSEDVVWIQIGLQYKYVFISKAIYQCDYLEGGLTKNDKLVKFGSPVGSMMRGKMLMHKECGVKQNVKGAIIYDCYKKCLKYTKKTYNFGISRREKILTFMFWPVGNLFYYKWRREAENQAGGAIR